MSRTCNPDITLIVHLNLSVRFVTLQMEQEGIYDLKICDISGKQIHIRQINLARGVTVQMDLSVVLSTDDSMLMARSIAFVQNDFEIMFSKLVIAD